MADGTEQTPVAPRVPTPVRPGLLGFSWIAIGGAAVALVLQLLFAASYIGALHDPKPKDLPIGIVAPEQIAPALIEQIRAQAGDAFDPQLKTSVEELYAAIDEVELAGGIVIDQSGPRLIIADAAGTSVTQAMTFFAQGFATAQRAELTIEHVHPLSAGDPRGLSTIYLVIAWVFGGYIVGTILVMVRGATYVNRQHVGLRLGLLAIYAILSGIFGALIAGPLIGAIDGHFRDIALAGTLIVFAVAVATMALQLLLGLIGTLLVIIFFVLIGNPASGGIVPFEFLPGFWRTIGPWLPNAAGYELLRNMLYFENNGITRPLVILAAYTIAGVAVLLAIGDRHRPWSPLDAETEAELSAAAGAAGA